MTDIVERIVTSGDVAIRCRTLGPEDGPLVLFLHGFPARWSTWRRIMPAFAAAGYLAVAPDQRGYGDSDKPEGIEAYGLPRLVADVIAILDAFGRARAFIVGHDFGGGVAWATAMAHPDRVIRLATLNSVHPVGFARQLRHWSQIEKSWYVFLFQVPSLPEWYLARADFAFLVLSLSKDGLSEEDTLDLLAGVKPKGALHAAIQWYRASFRDGLRKRFTPVKVDLPTLVVWGDRESHLDPELARPPPEWVSDVRVEHIAEGAHWVHHDAPEKVTALLLDHVRGGSRVSMGGHEK